MYKNKIVIVVTAVFLLLFVPGSAFALSEETPVDSPDLSNYQYVDRITSSLSITKGTASVSVKVRDADGDTSKITCTLYLQKYSGGSWNNIKSWFKSTDTNQLAMSYTKAVNKGKYRTKAVVKAYKGNSHETITKYSKICSY